MEERKVSCFRTPETLSIPERRSSVSTPRKFLFSLNAQLNCSTTVRLKVEENQLVDVFGEIASANIERAILPQNPIEDVDTGPGHLTYLMD